MQQEQERAEMENDGSLQTQSGGSGEENALDYETTANDAKENPDASCQVEMDVEAEGETRGEDTEKEEQAKKTRDEGEDENTSPAPTASPQPSISAEAESENRSSGHSPREEVRAEATTSSQNPDLLHHIQRRQPPTRGSHLTKRDKKIIEKIRSYYEAAAAEEEEAEEEEEQGEGAASRRRNSFSQIPSGLVKQSVSRFDVSGHQGGTESSQSKNETAEVIDRETDGDSHSSAGPISSSSSLPMDAENNEQANQPVTSLDFDADRPVKSPVSAVIQDTGTLNQEGVNQQSYSNRPVGKETDIQGNNGHVCRDATQERLEEKQDGETSFAAAEQEAEKSLQGEKPSITKEYRCRNDTAKPSAEIQAVTNGHEPDQAGPAEPSGSHQEPFRDPLPSTEQCQRPETKTQSSWTRTKHRDLAKTNRSLEGFPSQIKVGRWSYHSRVVTANRALFEGMGSDVAGIGLFEASPVADPMLMENSERILSKVQTLAQMYSAKASTMKVPLHQKRAGTVRNSSWGSDRPSGNSAQLNKTQTKPQSQTQVQIQSQIQTTTESQQQTRVNNKETKNGTQSHSEVKVHSQTVTQTRQHSQIQTQSKMWSQTQTHNQIQNQTKTKSQYQSQIMSQEDQTIQEERMMTREEILTGGRLTSLNHLR